MVNPDESGVESKHVLMSKLFQPNACLRWTGRVLLMPDMSEETTTTLVPSNGSPEESTALLSDTLSTGNPDESGVESKRNLKQEYYRALKIRGQAQS
jgi:hypothetical protein